MKPLYFSEHLGSVESFRNLINVGRGAISYINLEVVKYYELQFFPKFCIYSPVLLPQWLEKVFVLCGL